jgi:hypothetical protein
MNGTKKQKIEQFKLKKPVKIQYASSEDVAAATKEVLKEHSRLFYLLAKH